MTKSKAFLIGWIAALFGYVVEFIYDMTNTIFGVENIGLTIIVFTILTNLIMIPMMLRQQKSMKINNLLQPEIQAIQSKYKNKTDQKSQIRMQAETQAVYDKYGASMTGGCLTSLISLLIMFGLYRIILNMPAYIESFKVYYTNIASEIMNQGNYVDLLTDIATSKGIKVENLGQMNYLVDLMYKFKLADWNDLEAIFPTIKDVITVNLTKITEILSFGPINLMEAPGFRVSWALLIPVLAGLSQWISTKMMTPASQKKNSEDNPMGATMSTMNNVMPLVSVFFCFTLPCYIGIYWVVNSASRIPIQFFINRKVDKEDVNEIIRQNIEKKNKKRAKKGLPPLSEKTVEKNIEELERKMQIQSGSASSRHGSTSMKARADVGKQVNNTEYYNSRAAKPGSMAAKANMVRDYNERTSKK